MSLKIQSKLISDYENGKARVAPSKNGSSFHDPAFASNKTQPIHRWVPWIAGFSSDFVSHAIKQHLPIKGTVLDPFSGVGTTLVESVLACNNAVGFEINPYPCMASRIKATAYQIDELRLRHYVSKFISYYHEAVASNAEPISKPPESFKTRSDFYSPLVMRKVLRVFDYINCIEDESIHDVFRLAFASTMVKFSNYSYEPSLGRRISSGKSDILDFAVGEEIYSKLTEMCKDILWMKHKVSCIEPPTVKVINDSFFNYAEFLEEGSIDLLITSPPYLNNYHYNRNTRPQLYWLDFVKSTNDMKKLEHANFGKYWQTCREEDCIDLSFMLPDSDIVERLEEIRGLNQEKGIYGGNGWANYAASYFNDCYLFAKGINYVKRPGSTALVVLGNSILQGVHVPTDVYFGKIAESVGLELVDIHVPRATRIGNSIIQSEVRVGKAKAKEQLYESVVELRKL